MRVLLFALICLGGGVFTSFWFSLQSATECTDTDAEHTQPALPLCRAGGALSMEPPHGRYGLYFCAPVGMLHILLGTALGKWVSQIGRNSLKLFPQFLIFFRFYLDFFLAGPIFFPLFLGMGCHFLHRVTWVS